MWYALVLLASALGGEARRFTERDINKLPQLYHLDDYDRCLSQPGGLYCVGTFGLSADPHAPSYQYYRMVEEYSSSLLHFNRTLLHRGYCVSSRCASGALNRTRRQRFERCTQESEKALGLRVALHSYHCDVATTHETVAPRDRVFLWVVGALLLLNLAATLYDVSKNGEKKSKLLVAWSIRVNWQRVTANYEDGDPRFTALAPVQGVRVLLMLLVIILHVVTVNHQLFLHNPHYIERLLHLPPTMIGRNGTSIVQVFVVLSNFLFAYSLILLSKNKSIGFAQLPIFILHRIVRLLPVHLLVVGFAATWWRFSGSGPQWAYLVNAESHICRRKFLLHTLFLHNLVDNDEHCLLQTWFLAVDMQLFIVASLVMLTLTKSRWRPVPVLAALFAFACLMNALLAYYNEWPSFLFINVPEGLRTLLYSSRTFIDFYTSPWGSLPACFLGLLLAHVHYDMQQRGYDIHKNKLFMWLYQLTIPLLLAWFLGGSWLKEYRSPLASVIHIALERPVSSLLISITFLGIINNVDNLVRRVLSWRGWHALGRTSLAALMLHWCVLKTLVASRQHLTDFSLLNIATETCATCFFTYSLAFPLTILVEMPVMKTFTTLVFE